MLISVIIPVYNKSAYLERAIDCVRQQYYADWEIVMVDDGSSDDSLAIARRHEGERVRVFAQENAGAAAARNAAMAQAEGDIFAFLDADDVWHPSHLQALADIFAAHPNTGIASTRWTLLGAYKPSKNTPVEGQIEPVDYLTFMSETAGYFWTSCIAISRAAYDELGGMRDFKRGEDMEFWTRIAIRYPAAINRSLTAFYDPNETSISRRVDQSDNAAQKRERQTLTPTVALLYDLVRSDAGVNKDAVERFVDWRLSIGLLRAARSRDWAMLKESAAMVDNWPRMLSDIVKRRLSKKH